MKKKRTKPGRPTNKELSKTGPKTNWKMTPDLIQKLEAAFAIDCSVLEACAFADISTSGYYAFIKDNEEIKDRFTRLQQRPILRAKDSVFKGLKNNPELALKYLKSKLPKEFSGEVLNVETKSLHYHIIKMVKDLNEADNESVGDKTISE